MGSDRTGNPQVLLQPEVSGDVVRSRFARPGLPEHGRGRRRDGAMLDLTEINRRQLIEAGLERLNVS